MWSARGAAAPRRAELWRGDAARARAIVEEALAAVGGRRVPARTRRRCTRSARWAQADRGAARPRAAAPTPRPRRRAPPRCAAGERFDARLLDAGAARAGRLPRAARRRARPPRRPARRRRVGATRARRGSALGFRFHAALCALARGGGAAGRRRRPRRVPRRCSRRRTRRREALARAAACSSRSRPARRARVPRSPTAARPAAGRRADGRPVAARARGARPGRRGPHEPRDRLGAVHQREDGQRPRLAHPRQARRRATARRRRRSRTASASRLGDRERRREIGRPDREICRCGGGAALRIVVGRCRPRPRRARRTLTLDPDAVRRLGLPRRRRDRRAARGPARRAGGRARRPRGDGGAPARAAARARQRPRAGARRRAARRAARPACGSTTRASSPSCPGPGNPVGALADALAAGLQRVRRAPGWRRRAPRWSSWSCSTGCASSAGCRRRPRACSSAAARWPTSPRSPSRWRSAPAASARARPSTSPTRRTPRVERALRVTGVAPRHVRVLAERPRRSAWSPPRSPPRSRPTAPRGACPPASSPPPARPAPAPSIRSRSCARVCDDAGPVAARRRRLRRGGGAVRRGPRAAARARAGRLADARPAQVAVPAARGRLPAGARRRRAGAHLQRRAAPTCATPPPADAEVNFADRGIQLTRQFRALKLWMSLKVFGAAAFRAAIEHGLALAEHAEALLARRPRVGGRDARRGSASSPSARAPGASPPSSTRSAPRLPAAALADGFAYVSTPPGRAARTALRLCTINPRTTREDVERTIDRLADARTRSPPMTDTLDRRAFLQALAARRRCRRSSLANAPARHGRRPRRRAGASSCSAPAWPAWAPPTT